MISDFGLQLVLDLLVLNVVPTVINFVVRYHDLRFWYELWILLRRNSWSKHGEHVPIYVGKLSAFEMAGIIEAIDVDRANLRLPVTADFLIAPIEVGTAVVNIDVDIDVHVYIYVRDVRDVDGVLNDVDVAPALQEAAASVIIARAKMADFDESVVVRPDITFPIDPGTDTDADPAGGFRRQWRPADTSTVRGPTGTP